MCPVTDQQVRLLFSLMAEGGKSVSTAAAQAGMSPRTAHKYLRSDELPSPQVRPRSWRTRVDPFDGVWSEVKQMLERYPSVQGKELFLWLQRKYPGQFASGQLRTLQ